MKKEQALDMAKKLGFKDKLANEVCDWNLFIILNKKYVCFVVLGSRSDS
jgi:hypothetical protein